MIRKRSWAWLLLMATVALCLALTGCQWLGFRGYLISTSASGDTRALEALVGDQYFKTAVALVELHKVRYGEYPNSLQDLKFTSAFDKAAINAVEYHKLANGYELNLVRGIKERPELSYPPDFWRGLGLVKTNVKIGNAPPEVKP